MKAPELKPRAVWRPPGWHPPGAATFLQALTAADSVGLRAWAAAAPDPAWAEWLHGQGLAAYACHQLRCAGALALLPSAFQAALRGHYYAAAGDAELHVRELATVLDLLAAAGVTPLVFKGAALAFTAYPDPACRPMGDLDLWLTAEAMPRGLAALEAAGYRQRTKEARPLALQAQRQGEIQLFGGQPGHGLVELHWGVFAGEWLRQAAAVDSASVGCRAVQVTLAGRPAWTLAVEDAIIQLAVHLAVNHQMAYPGLRGVLDIALAATSGLIDWEAVAARARAWRVATPTWLVLSLVAELFGSPGAGAASARLRPSAARRRALARFTGARAVLDGRDITHSPLRFIYQLMLVDRPRDAARLLWRALWPDRAWLMARYGSAAFGVRVRHLLGAARGRV